MNSTIILLILTLLPTRGGATERPAVRAETARKAPAKPMTLDILVKRALVDGAPNRIPGPLADLVGVSPNTPIHNFAVEPEQASDKMAHDFKVMVEIASDTKKVSPIGLVLVSTHEWPGNAETHFFRASVDRALIKAAALRGTLD